MNQYDHPPSDHELKNHDALMPRIRGMLHHTGVEREYRRHVVKRAVNMLLDKLEDIDVTTLPEAEVKEMVSWAVRLAAYSIRRGKTTRETVAEYWAERTALVSKSDDDLVNLLFKVRVAELIRDKLLKNGMTESSIDALIETGSQRVSAETLASDRLAAGKAISTETAVNIVSKAVNVARNDLAHLRKEALDTLD